MSDQRPIAELMRAHAPLAADDGFDPASPYAAAALERILADPGLVPSTRRARSHRGRAPRYVVQVAAVAAAGAVAFAALPSSDRAPGVIAEAAAALDAPDVVFHYRTVKRTKNGLVSERTEVWQSSDGHRERELWSYRDGPLNEHVFDLDSRTDLSYDPGRDEVVRHTDPDAFTGREGFDAGSIDLVNVAGILAGAEASDDPRVEVVGRSTVRGIPADELRFDEPAGPDADGKPTTFTRVLSVDREHHLPVRVVETASTGSTVDFTAVTDFYDIERLDRTPATDALLQMAPHPDAKRSVEGPVSVR